LIPSAANFGRQVQRSFALALNGTLQMGDVIDPFDLVGSSAPF